MEHNIIDKIPTERCKIIFFKYKKYKHNLQI